MTPNREALRAVRTLEDKKTVELAVDVMESAMRAERLGELSGQDAAAWLENSKIRTAASALAAKAIRHLPPVEA